MADECDQTTEPSSSNETGTGSPDFSAIEDLLSRRSKTADLLEDLQKLNRKAAIELFLEGRKLLHDMKKKEKKRQKKKKAKKRKLTERARSNESSEI